MRNGEDYDKIDRLCNTIVDNGLAVASEYNPPIPAGIIQRYTNRGTGGDSPQGRGGFEINNI